MDKIEKQLEDRIDKRIDAIVEEFSADLRSTLGDFTECVRINSNDFNRGLKVGAQARDAWEKHLDAVCINGTYYDFCDCGNHDECEEKCALFAYCANCYPISLCGILFGTDLTGRAFTMREKE